MSLQAFVWAIRTLALLAGGAFWLLVTFLDPDGVGIYGTILFYLLAGFFLLGVCYLAILGLYRIFLGDERAVQYLGGAFRQAFLLVAGMVVLALLFQYQFWYWWSILLVTAFVLLLEFTIRSLFYPPEKSQ